MIIILLLLTALWAISVMSLARWRVQILLERGLHISPRNDWIVQAYLKGSGVVILCIVSKLIAGS